MDSTSATDRYARRFNGYAARGYINGQRPQCCVCICHSWRVSLYQAHADRMTYPTPLPSLDLSIEQWLRTGNTLALKKALVEQGLLDGFADYLMNLFTDDMRFTDSAMAAHDFVDLVHEFGGNREQQKAVMGLLPQNRQSWELVHSVSEAGTRMGQLVQGLYDRDTDIACVHETFGIKHD